jgi:acylphosphatase
MNAEIIRRIIVTGRVQGVGFRAFVAREAKHRRAEGWVRNRRDGKVEAVFAGAATVIDDLIAACRMGPIGARVTDIIETQAVAADLDVRPPGVAFAVLA